MSLRAGLIVAALLGCSGTPSRRAGAPARDDHRGEARGSDATANGKAWGRWRYKGDRDACFFEVGGRCFQTETAACKAARCKACTVTGAGPAQVSCR